MTLRRLSRLPTQLGDSGRHSYPALSLGRSLRGFFRSSHVFQCPKGEKLALKVANGAQRGDTKALQVTGHLGLGIEILDAPTPRFGFKASVRGNRS